MTEGSHWLSWCRLCAKDDAKGNVKVQPSDRSTGAWDNVLIMAIRKYFEVHMRLEDELSSVLCTECYTLISELIDFAEHVTKVQAIFEVLRRTESERSEILDVAALRQQYGLGEEDFTHIIKPVPAPDFENPLEELVSEMVQEVPEIPEKVLLKRESFEEIEFLKIEREENPLYLHNALTQSLNPREYLELQQSLAKETSGYLELAVIQEEPSLNASADSTVDNDVRPEDPTLLAQEPHQGDAISSREEPPPDERTKRGRMSCGRCGKLYRNRASYEKHIENECRRIKRRVKMDKSSTTCELCNKKLSSATALKLHKKGMHQNVKPYICDSCGKQLKTITALNEHKLVHTDSRPFECTVCNARFKNRARLKAHHQIHAEPSFVCNICGKKLQTRRTWNMHKVVHSEERRLKCDVCGALFKRSKTLKTHLLSHTGLRPYICNYCGKSFACNANCRSHKLKKHPQEVQQDDGASLSSRLNVPTLEELRVM
ncbi:hypothetical protein KR009_007816 [Drosophila setifemur]|nr:hypothetical protein KR009_007816 [Drosophila setifemur]